LTPPLAAGFGRYFESEAETRHSALGPKSVTRYETLGYTHMLCHIGGGCPCHIQVDSGYL